MNRHAIALLAALLAPAPGRAAAPSSAQLHHCLSNSGPDCEVSSDFDSGLGFDGLPYEEHKELGTKTGLVPPEELWVKATETGSVRAYASTGQPPGAGDPHVEGVAKLVWRGTYSRNSALDSGGFTLNKRWVYVIASLMGRGTLKGAGTSYAEWSIEVKVEAASIIFAHTVYSFEQHLRMEAVEDGVSPPRVVDAGSTFSGDECQTFPDMAMFTFTTGNSWARQEYPSQRFPVSLACLTLVSAYNVTYTLTARAGVDDRGVDPPRHAEAFVGDPFDATGGFTWETTSTPQEGDEPGQCQRAFDAGRWTTHADGTADDLYTGLTWRRCGLGRALSDAGTADPLDDRCTGTDTGQGWQQALQAAAADTTGGFADWRLPNAKELESLVDLQCSPLIESRIFPDTSRGLWWTSTPEPGTGNARMISFFTGESVEGARSGTLGLSRLVRDGGATTVTPLPMVSVARPLPVAEGDAGTVELVFPVSLDRPAAAAVTVDYQTADISARAGADYTATSGTLTFPAGTTLVEVRVPVAGDTLGEGNEYLALLLANVSPNARLGVIRAVGTILDDEPVVSIGDARVVEGNAGSPDLVFPVTLDRPASGDVIVDWTTADGTATGGVDYLSQTASLTIPAGQTSGSAVVTVLSDRAVEPDETLTVTLTLASGNARLGRAVGTGTIANDDVPGPPVLDAVRYVGSMGGIGNADGTGAGVRFSSPSWITPGLLVDGSRIRAFGPGGEITTLPGSYSASGIALAPGGTAAYFTQGNRVQRLAQDGTVTTLAGSGAAGSADGTGTGATFNGPSGIAVDGAGNVYVCDTGNFTIRAITPDGLVTTLAGSAGVSGSTDGTGSAARLFRPRGLTIHPTTGLLYVGDGFAVRTVTAGGAVATIAGVTNAVGAVDSADPLAARFRGTEGLVADGAGNVYVADASNNAIRKIDPAAGVSTLAGTMGQAGDADGTGAAARFHLPLGITYSLDFLWVTDNNNYTLRRVSPAGEVVTIAGEAPRSGGDNGSAATATFRQLKGIAPGAVDGQLFLADALDDTLRRVDPDGTGAAATVTAVAGLGPFAGSADGTGSTARFRTPWGVSQGGSYVADTGNCTLRAVDAQAAVTTVAGAVQTCALTDGTGAAARFRSPVALWTAGSGTVYVADTYAIRAFDPTTAAVTTVAGASTGGNLDGTGSAARFGQALGLCGDAAGNLYVADNANSAIRKIAPGGVVTTLSGGAGYRDGPVAQALFLRPSDVACAPDGTLYVADTDNVVVRKIAPDGQVSTILGTQGQQGFAPMAGPSTIGKPQRLALQGNVLYVTMYGGVLKVTLQ